jgi:hypothetical protein
MEWKGKNWSGVHLEVERVAVQVAVVCADQINLSAGSYQIRACILDVCTTLPLMRLSFSHLYSVVILHVVRASYSGPFCPQACDLALGYPIFNDTDAWLSKKVRSCRSKFRITSLYLCFAQYCEDDGEPEKWIGDDSPWCDEHAGVPMPFYHDVIDGWTARDRDRVTRLSAEEAMSFPVLSEVVIPDASYFDRAFTTMVSSHSLWKTTY